MRVLWVEVIHFQVKTCFEETFNKLYIIISLFFIPNYQHIVALNSFLRTSNTFQTNEIEYLHKLSTILHYLYDSFSVFDWIDEFYTIYVSVYEHVFNFPWWRLQIGHLLMPFAYAVLLCFHIWWPCHKPRIQDAAYQLNEPKYLKTENIYIYLVNIYCSSLCDSIFIRHRLVTKFMTFNWMFPLVYRRYAGLLWWYWRGVTNIVRIIHFHI